MRSAVALLLLTLSSTAVADGYQPSQFRAYGGPIAFAGSDIWGFGGTLAFQWYPEKHRVFFFGPRAAFLGGALTGYNGVGGFVDLELGIRPRLVASDRNAFAAILSASVGPAYLSCFCETQFWVVHVSARAGVGFDASAFTMNATGGIAVLGNAGALAAAEVILDLGVRF